MGRKPSENLTSETREENIARSHIVGMISALNPDFDEGTSENRRRAHVKLNRVRGQRARIRRLGQKEKKPIAASKAERAMAELQAGRIG